MEVAVPLLVAGMLRSGHTFGKLGGRGRPLVRYLRQDIKLPLAGFTALQGIHRGFCNNSCIQLCVRARELVGFSPFRIALCILGSYLYFYLKFLHATRHLIYFLFLGEGRG